MPTRTVLIVVENGTLPEDIRVRYEAETLSDDGWQVSVICPAATGAHLAGKEPPKVTSLPENIKGVSVYRFPLVYAEHGALSFVKEYIKAFFATARLSWRAWRNNRFDIIHFCNPPDIFFPIGLFYRLLGAKVVFDHHDLFPETVAPRFHGMPGKLLYAFARITEYLTFKCANTVISTNDYYRKIAIERGGVSPERVFVVRNGPKLNEFVPVDPVPELKQRYPHMACYVGVMGNEAGIMGLITAIRHIVHDLNRRDILFCLLGDGVVRPQALAAVKKWELEDFVELPGMVWDSQLLRQYLCTADVCLSPNPANPHRTYSTPIKLGEYMAMGKPMVAFDLPETRHTAQDAAIYVQPGDIHGFGQAIVNLIDDPDMRQQMSEFGRQRVIDRLSWEHQSPNLFRAYEVALGSKNGNKKPHNRKTPECQLQSLPDTSERTLKLSIPLHFRLRLMIKRRLSPQRRKAWKKRLRLVTDRWGWSRGKDSHAQPEIKNVTAGFQPGDLVRVRSLEEIKNTLDRDQRLKGCSFMPEMEPFCGTTYRVFKSVERFLDERDYRVKQTSGILILEGVMCEGTAEFGPCDRSCFFFWRQEWLEKVE